MLAAGTGRSGMAAALRRASAGGEDENERHRRFSEPLFNPLDEELADVKAERLAVIDLLV